MPAIRFEGDSVPPYAFDATEGFAPWLYDAHATLALTTYEIGKVFLISAESPERLRILERTFDRAMGLSVSGTTLLLATKNAVVRFENAVPKGERLDDQDALFIPQAVWFTGDVFAHDVGLTDADRPIFVNTSFSCLGCIDERSSFRPIWQPPFVTQLAPQDRCHLNGLAMDNGRPRYVTLIAATNEGGAWRNYRVGGGLVMDVETNGVVVGNLSMPHSPRLHDGRLWLLQAGTGEVGFVDAASGKFEAAAFCPGFVRGLAFHGNHALVGTSLARTNALFSGLPLEEGLTARGMNAECAVHVVDLARGTIAHKLKIGGLVREFYEVALIPNLRRPGLLGVGSLAASMADLSKLITRGPNLALSDVTRGGDSR